MRIAGDLAIIGSGQFGLSCRWDCHIYALRGPDGVVLLDAGCGLAVDALESNLAAAFTFDPVRAIVVTHAHADHFGGAAELSRRLRCPVLAPKISADIIRDADEERCGLRLARDAGGYPPELRLSPCAISDVFAHGDRLKLAGLTFDIIGVSGHSHDSFCFLTSIFGARALFSADTVFYGGVLGVINTLDSGMQGYRCDLPRLKNLGIEALFPGHGLFTLRDGQRHIDIALEQCARGFLPRQIGQGDLIF